MKKIKLLILTLAITIGANCQTPFVNKWTSFIDLSKNGFPGHFDNFHIKVLPKGYKLKEITDNGIAVAPIVFVKSNGKNILLSYFSKEKLFQFEYDKITEMSDNTYEVEINGKIGIIDSLGNIIIPIIYKSVSSLDPGIYYFAEDKFDQQFQINPETQYFECREENRKTSVIDRNKKIIISRKYTDQIKSFYYVYENSIYCILNFDDIQNRKKTNSETYTLASSKFGEPPTKYYVGAEFHYPESTIFDKFYKVIINIGGRKNIIFDLKEFSPVNTIPVFGNIYQFSTEYSQTRSEDEMMDNLISRNCKVIIPFKYFDITPFNIDNDYGKIAEGYYEWKEKFDKSEIVEDWIDIILKKDSLVLIRNKEGLLGLFKIGIGEVVTTKYKAIERVTMRYAIIQDKNEFWDVLDLTNLKLLFNKKYDSIEYDDKGFKCVLDGKEEIIILE
jgi:hypothetical protein